MEQYGKVSNENTLFKQEVESLKTGVDFQINSFEEAKSNLEEMRAGDPIEEDIKLKDKKHQLLEEKNSELQDRFRLNNPRFSRFTKKGDGDKTWDLIKENLEMESKDIIIERAYRTGSKIKSKKRVIIVKCLN